METTNHPSKEQVRQFMTNRRVATTPPPSPDEIRRQLGWGMLYNANPLKMECTR